MGMTSSRPWLAIGDFNDIKSPYEKRGGPSRLASSFHVFKRMLTICGLHDVKMTGGRFTWTGQRYNYCIKSKIDRALANCEWLNVFPDAFVQLLPWIGSDHRPLLLHTASRSWTRHSLFRYDNRWRNNPEIHQVINNAWSLILSHNPNSRFTEMLDECRRALADWKHRNRWNSSAQIVELKHQLHEAYNAEGFDYSYIGSLKSKLYMAYRLEEEYWKTKSKIHWLQAGDRNTTYFHAKTKQRRAHNRISHITDDEGRLLTEPKDIQVQIVKYFQSLFTASKCTISSELLGSGPSIITDDINAELTKPISEVEVKDAVFAISPDKSPGPDGFNAGFFHYHWNTIKSGVLKYVNLFFEYGYLEPGMNHTYICLIPKTESPISVKDYWPISLANVAYKIISKILAQRLKPWLHQIISENQSAFVLGRLITDNILIAHELFHSLHSRKRVQDSMAVKLDISKAYGKLEWSFLDVLMEKMGFNVVWRKWIMKCVSSVTYSVLVNGSLTSTIIPQRGIRQGDPISPFLYLICTEGLSRLIDSRVQMAKLTGFKASRSGPVISHLLFADDSLLFMKATGSECQELLDVLSIYQKASGQEINYKKSAITFSKHTPYHTRISICELMGIKKTGGFERYLGLPERIGKNRYDAFSYLAHRVHHKLQKWYANFLSPAGKEVLIKVVAMALPTYTMSCYMLPKQLLNQTTFVIRKFWWSSNNQKRKMAWITWKKLTKIKSEGGLGIRDLQDFNIALLAKQGWRLMNHPQSLLARIYKAKYYSHTSFLEAKSNNQSSYAWRSIIQSQSLLHHGIRWRVGDGKNINVWRDNWLPLNPSRPARGTGAITQPLLMVSDLIISGAGQWNRSKLDEFISQEDISLVQQIRPAQTNVADYVSWLYTTDGNYTVKSGYYVQSHVINQATASVPYGQDSVIDLQKLYRAIWKIDAPPKIKHFWWRVAHDSIPVADTLISRGCLVERSCLFCGEDDETINHMLFQCRLSREVWDLALLHTPSGQCMQVNTLLQNLLTFLIPPPTRRLNTGIFPFIGWRLWKLRNNILFRQRKEYIPQIINNALVDYRLWTESKQWNDGGTRSLVIQSCLTVLSMQELYTQKSKYCCLVDASWKSPTERAGIGWILYQCDGQRILQGKTSIDPISTPGEAEAFALLSAVKESRKLNFHNVVFVGDSKALYDELDRIERTNHSTYVGNSSIASLVQDIKELASSTYVYSFRRVNRSMVKEADALAKVARQQNLMCMITWQTL